MNYLIDNASYQQNIEKIGLNVEDFVNENPVLLPLLVAAPAIIKKYIPDATFELSHNTDFEEGNSTLYLTIFTDLHRKICKNHMLSLFGDVDFGPYMKNREICKIFAFTTETRHN